MRTFIAALVGGLVVLVSQMLVGMLWLPATLARPSGSAAWGVAADLILAATLAGLARRSRLHGMALAGLLFGVAFVIGSATGLLEAVVFGVLPVSTVWALMPMSSVPLAAGAIAVVVTAGAWSRAARPAASPPSGPVAAFVARGAAASAFYVVCYFTAGAIIFPWVRTFYEAHRLPPFETVLALQFFVRGPIFVLTIALLVRQLSGSRRLHALAAGAAMAILGGVVPLLVPNPFFPDVVRWAHFAETASSNFVFGAVTGWLMSPSRAILPHGQPSHGPAKEIAHGGIG